MDDKDCCLQPQMRLYSPQGQGRKCGQTQEVGTVMRQCDPLVLTGEVAWPTSTHRGNCMTNCTPDNTAALYRQDAVTVTGLSSSWHALSIWPIAACRWLAVVAFSVHVIRVIITIVSCLSFIRDFIRMHTHTGYSISPPARPYILYGQYITNALA